ncbi:hypothetical protein BJ742DRAFT_909104 [Cladochytrium replicatum]|nr:hypothetical protein BJ742DRAFT_909104 [Cladochytrium replicatum]
MYSLRDMIFANERVQKVTPGTEDVDPTADLMVPSGRKVFLPSMDDDVLAKPKSYPGSRMSSPPRRRQLSSDLDESDALLTRIRELESKLAHQHEEELKTQQQLSQVHAKLVRQEELENETTKRNERIAELVQHSKDFELQKKEQQDRLELLTKENESFINKISHLNEELARSAQGDPNVVKVTTAAWKESNERIQILIEENDALAKQSRSDQRESEELRERLRTSMNDLNGRTKYAEDLKQKLRASEAEKESLRDEHQSLEREYRRCVADLQSATEENEELHAAIKRSVADNAIQQGRIVDLSRDLEEITARYQAQLSDAAQMATRDSDMLNNFKLLEADLDERKATHEVLERKHNALKKEHEELLSLSKGMEKKITQLETKVVDTFQEAQKSIEKGEDAKLERDKALLREEQAQREIKRLSSKLQEISAKSREKYEQEIAALRAQFVGEKKRMAEDISKLELSHAQMQSQMDRAIREKRAVESELSKISKSFPLESERLHNLMEELNEKLRMCERERAEATQRYESLHQKYSREQNRYEKDREIISAKGEEFYRRVRRLEQELQEAKNDRLKLLEQIQELENVRRGLEETQIKIESKNTALVSSLTERYEGQATELSSRLETVSEAHARTCREYQQLLSDQRRMSDRWKEESKRITSHYETALCDLRAQVSRLQARIADQESDRARLAVQKTELSQALAEEKRAGARLHAAVQNAEMRAQAGTRQIQQLINTEKDLLGEKKHLQREVDRLNFELERIERERALQRKQDVSSVHPQSFDEPYDNISREVETLKAQIDRVNKRSRLRHVKSFKVNLDFDDDMEGDSENDDGEHEEE